MFMRIPEGGRKRAWDLLEMLGPTHGMLDKNQAKLRALGLS